MHTNKINGKRYIGWTSKTMEERWNSHWKTALFYKTKLLFHLAIQKYGVESFTHEILASVETRDDAKAQEKLLIKSYNSYAFKEGGWGYNGTQGGDGAVGYKHTPESLKKMSTSQLGDKNHMFGKSVSQETKEKLKEKLKGRIFSEEHCKNLQKAGQGRIQSEETKQKIREKCSNVTPEQKEKRKKSLEQKRLKAISCVVCNKLILTKTTQETFHNSCFRKSNKIENQAFSTIGSHEPSQ